MPEHNADADYMPIGRTLRLRVNLGNIPVGDRFLLLHDLLDNLKVFENLSFAEAQKLNEAIDLARKAAK